MKWLPNWIKKELVYLPKDLPEEERGKYRVIRLPGTHNFRDMGGYKTENGRFTKWGTLYRSDALSRLRKRAAPIFNQLDLHVIIDLRSTYERASDPNKIPKGTNLKLVEIPILDRANNLGRSLFKRLLQGDVAGLDGFALMVDANRQFVTEYNAEYRLFLEQVLAANGRPVLFHCTGGKDRTGFAAALLLRSLGVPKSTIYEDYFISNQLILPFLQNRLKLYTMLRGNAAGQIVQDLAQVHGNYMDAAFDCIEETYGSFEGYITDGLGLHLSIRQELQQMLLS